MAEATPHAAHPGTILGIARFYHDPRGSTRAMLASGPGEARLLSYAMLAAMILLIQRVMGVLADPGADDVAGQVAAQTVSTLFFLPLVYYGVAALGTMIARAFGGEGGWPEGRAAFFWAALVSAPVALLGSLLALVLADGPGAAAAGQIGAVFLAWALANTFAEVFGFASVLRTGAVVVLTGAVAIGLLWAISLTGKA